MLEAPVFAGTHFILGEYELHNGDLKPLEAYQNIRVMVYGSRTVQESRHMVYL